MVSQTDASGNHGLQPHRSYWPIALALLGLVVGLLGTAVILDRQLRPRVGIEPLPAVRVEEAPTTAQPAAAPATMATGLPAEDGPSAPQLEEEVEQAYRRYWDLYSGALYTLDTSRVGQVAANEELRRIEEEVSGFRAQARAVRADVSHSYLIVDITDAGATVYDEITDRSFLIDPATKQPSRGPDTAHLVKDIFYLTKVDGAWKVTKHLRQEG